MNPQQDRTSRVLGLLLLVAVLGSQGAAIDLNSSTNLRYFPDNNLEFQVQTDGTIQPQGDIELDGNNIDTSGNPITLRDSTNTQDILRAQEGGNLEIPNGNLFTQGAVQFDFGNGASYQILEEGGVLKLQTADGTDGIELDAGNDVSIPNGNLDVSGNNITSIDTLKFEEGTSIDGNVSIEGNIDTTGNINLSDNNLLDANNVQTNRLVDPEDEQINIDDNINLQNNQNIRSSGTNAITLDNQQNIEIPNGNLSITGNAPNSNLNLGGDIDTEVARIDTEGNNYFISLKSGKGFEVADPGGNIEFATGDDTTEIGSTYTFDISSNEFSLNQDDTDILTADTGSASHAIRDTANSADLVTLQEGGPVTIRNPIADEDVLRVNASGGSNVEIPNGNIDAQGNRIVDTTASDTVRLGDSDSNTVSIDAGGSGETVVNSGDGGSGSTERLRVTSSGGEADVDVSNSDVDLQGNSVTSSGGEVCIGDNCA
jgi:hypothetical protein